MTYCLAVKLEAGIVFASDSRTNAGIDYVTRYSKMYVFAPNPDRFFVMVSAGNLATTQEIVHRMERDLDATDGRESLATARYTFEAAAYVGGLSQKVQDAHRGALAASGVSGETTLIVGGQVRGRPPGLHLVYPQGNFISATPQTPFLQIGESKYGKPMLDRFARTVDTLDDAARLVLVSLDATMQSNVSVGPPFEIAFYTADSLRLERRFTLAPETEYFRSYRQAWETSLSRAFRSLPAFEWETPEGKPAS